MSFTAGHIWIGPVGTGEPSLTDLNWVDIGTVSEEPTNILDRIDDSLLAWCDAQRSTGEEWPFGSF